MAVRSTLPLKLEGDKMKGSVSNQSLRRHSRRSKSQRRLFWVGVPPLAGTYTPESQESARHSTRYLQGCVENC
jgi:hypothetical protein